MQDLTALAKELRAVEDVRPPHKVTDYSSSSEESGTTDEEDDDVEQEGAEEPTSGPEDTRAASVPLSAREDECPRGLPRWPSGKRPACQRRRCGFDPWVGKIPGEGNGNPFQCSCLEDPTDRGAWRAAVHGVAESQTPRRALTSVPRWAFFPAGTRFVNLSSGPGNGTFCWGREPVCPFFGLVRVPVRASLQDSVSLTFSF